MARPTPSTLPAVCALNSALRRCIFILAHVAHTPRAPRPHYLTVIVQKLTKIYVRETLQRVYACVYVCERVCTTKQTLGEFSTQAKLKMKKKRAKLSHFLVLMYVNYRGIFHAEDLHFNLCTEKFAYFQNKTRNNNDNSTRKQAKVDERKRTENDKKTKKNNKNKREFLQMGTCSSAIIRGLLYKCISEHKSLYIYKYVLEGTSLLIWPKSAVAMLLLKLLPD